MNGEKPGPMLRIASLLEYVRSHLDADLNVAVLAARAGFSPFHFQRIFRLAVGQTIGEYIRTRRLQRAAVRLRESDDPITVIALESGYDTPSAFSRAFLQSYGVPPSTFRDDWGFSPFTGGDMDVRIEQLPRYRFLAMRQFGPYSNAPVLWERFEAHLAERGLYAPEALTVGLSYDDPETIELDSLRYDACIESDEPADDVLREIVIDAGRWAIYRHIGPYELIGHCFDRLIDTLVFIQKVDLRDAPCMELYLNDPHTTTPDRYSTDLAVPIV